MGRQYTVQTILKPKDKTTVKATKTTLKTTLKTAVLFIGSLSTCWVSTGLKVAADPLLQSSIGTAGIDASRLQQPPYNLTGRKIAIGQVEIGRPGQFGIDKAVSNNPAVSIVRVFFRNAPAKTNVNVDPHAQNVASIMVSNSKALKGVAPEARLYSSAVGLLKRNGQPEECLSAQHVAQQNGGDVRAINFSFGESLREDPRVQPVLDGNALLTQCIDWSTRVHNVLYVIAGNQGKGGIPIPTDNFNGMNVAFSTRWRSNPDFENGESKQLRNLFAKVDFANIGDPASGIASRIIGLESNVGPRRAISLLAPGNNISVMNPDGRLTKATGTSFAAPHVTASVALLQEFGDRQLSQRRPNWSTDSRRHEVMKAVLMNSTDKIKDSGNGYFLQMTRTIFDKSNNTWFDSDAYRDRQIPLHAQMGTGQLNVFRAYQQFKAGQYAPMTPVPTIGWDYRAVSAPGNSNSPASPNPPFRDYILNQPLQKDSFISITLVWDRIVELNDRNGNGEFDLGEGFRDRGLNNLDLYLMRVEDNDLNQGIQASVSQVDSVEHIFHAIPQTGRYKIRVVYNQRQNEPNQPYAIAWWSLPAP